MPKLLPFNSTLVIRHDVKPILYLHTVKLRMINQNKFPVADAQLDKLLEDLERIQNVQEFKTVSNIHNYVLYSIDTIITTMAIVIVVIRKCNNWIRQTIDSEMELNTFDSAIFVLRDGRKYYINLMPIQSNNQ